MCRVLPAAVNEPEINPIINVDEAAHFRIADHCADPLIRFMIGLNFAPAGRFICYQRRSQPRENTRSIAGTWRCGFAGKMLRANRFLSDEQRRAMC